VSAALLVIPGAERRPPDIKVPEVESVVNAPVPEVLAPIFTELRLPPVNVAEPSVILEPVMVDAEVIVLEV